MLKDMNSTWDEILSPAPASLYGHKELDSLKVSLLDGGAFLRCRNSGESQKAALLLAYPRETLVTWLFKLHNRPFPAPGAPTGSGGYRGILKPIYTSLSLWKY